MERKTADGFGEDLLTMSHSLQLFVGRTEVTLLAWLLMDNMMFNMKFDLKRL